MLSKDEKLVFLNSKIQLEKDLIAKLDFIYKDDEKVRDEEKEKCKFIISAFHREMNQIRFFASHGISRS